MLRIGSPIAILFSPIDTPGKPARVFLVSMSRQNTTAYLYGASVTMEKKKFSDTAASLVFSLSKDFNEMKTKNSKGFYDEIDQKLNLVTNQGPML